MVEPDIIQEIEGDDREFLESFLGKAWADFERSDLDVRLDWLMEKLARAQGLVAQNDGVAKERHGHIEDWRQGENAKLGRQISYLEWCIRELMPPDQQTFEKAYGQKSRALPFGVVGYRKSPDTIEVFDEARALEWARLHKLEIKVKESVSKTDLKRAIQHTEDPPDGFQLVPGTSELFIKVDDNGERKGL